LGGRKGACFPRGVERNHAIHREDGKGPEIGIC